MSLTRLILVYYFMILFLLTTIPRPSSQGVVKLVAGLCGVRPCYCDENDRARRAALEAGPFGGPINSPISLSRYSAKYPPGKSSKGSQKGAKENPENPPRLLTPSERAYEELAQSIKRRKEEVEWRKACFQNQMRIGPGQNDKDRSCKFKVH